MKIVSTILLFSSLISAAAPSIDARYVRIELPGKNRVLTLAEVEILSGGKNIARSGKATQSSVSANGTADRAIDGNKSPQYASNGQTHSKEGEKNPWWELDLGKSSKIELVTIWNRGDGLGERLDGFTFTLLDKKRKKIFQKEGIKAPEFSADVDFRIGGEVSYRDANGKTAKVVQVSSDYRDPSPFKFKKGDTVAIIGNSLAERMQHDGWLEALIQSEVPGMELSFRNMSLSGDRANKYPLLRSQHPEHRLLQCLHQLARLEHQLLVEQLHRLVLCTFLLKHFSMPH